MCGIVGVVGQSPVNQQIYDALTVLQHRGQDAAGIMTSYDGEVLMRKQNGLVRDVFQQRHMLALKGNIGIGHVRYPTAGGDTSSESQPFFVNSPFGIGLGHNGNLTNASELAEVLVREDRRHLNTSSDSEVLLNVLASELSRVGRMRASAADIFTALSAVYRRCRGGFACVAMIVGHGLVGFRDAHGIRPLILGRRQTVQGDEYMLASESVALDQAGYAVVRDIAAGEAVFIDERGRLYSHQCAPAAKHTPCVFEYVYFARPDSIIDNISVHKLACVWANLLAEKIAASIPITISKWYYDSRHHRSAAVQVAQLLVSKYREGFVKNRYIGRTFSCGTGAAREIGTQQAERHRLEFRGKKCFVVDDSIVRGTLGANYRSGARSGRTQSVFASAAPAGSLSECVRHRYACCVGTHCQR